AVRPSALSRVDRADATALGAHAGLRFLIHLDLGDHPADRWIRSGEVDAGGLADQAAPSVAPGEIGRSERRAAGQLDIDAAVVLREAQHLAAATDRYPEVTDHPFGQDALEVELPQRKQIVVAGREVADVQGDHGVARGRMWLARRDEPVRDAALIQHLDGAGVKTTGSRS